MKLGTAGAPAEAHGEGGLPSRRRKPKKPEQVAARVEGFRCERKEKPCSPGVTRLNAGFHELERMRAATVAKAKLKRAKKVKGER